MQAVDKFSFIFDFLCGHLCTSRVAVSAGDKGCNDLQMNHVRVMAYFMHDDTSLGLKA